MRRFSAFLCGAAAVLLLGPAGARADFANWSYNWNPTPPSGDYMATTGVGKFNLSNEPAGSATGNSDIVASNVKVYSTENPKKPAVFTNVAYSLTLFLLDEGSGKSGTLTFTGALSGTVSMKSSKLTNVFTGLVKQSILLGSHVYTVTMNAYSPPGPPTASKLGSIGASVTVEGRDGGPPSNGTPEPSTMVLAGLGLSFLGAASWRKRRGRRSDQA
jgi:hypothetical protein